MQSYSNALKNDEWITDAEVPDPNPLPEVPGYHILVRPVSVKSATKGGIILPDSIKSDMAYLTTVGRVLKVGTLAYADDKFKGRPWCKEGDYVCYGKHTGNKFFYRGVQLLLIFDDDVKMVVSDSKDLDPTYNLSN
jgi:co-chaperonin GroES (HSP10)|uniref:Co-chaperonin GroES n=1 Tax=uncultured virus TaxID=340016 RepID=A0A221S4E1_9VIRU|nr:co-chaperonin GroES [uncultured virus]